MDLPTLNPHVPHVASDLSDTLVNTIYTKRESTHQLIIGPYTTHATLYFLPFGTKLLILLCTQYLNLTCLRRQKNKIEHQETRQTSDAKLNWRRTTNLTPSTRTVRCKLELKTTLSRASYMTQHQKIRSFMTTYRKSKL